MNVLVNHTSTHYFDKLSTELKCGDEERHVVFLVLSSLWRESMQNLVALRESENSPRQDTATSSPPHVFSPYWWA